MTYLQKLPKNVGDLGKTIAAKGFIDLPNESSILPSSMLHQVSGCNVALLGSTKRLTSLLAFVNLAIWVAQNALAIGKIFCIKLPTNLLIF